MNIVEYTNFACVQLKVAFCCLSPQGIFQQFALLGCLSLYVVFDFKKLVHWINVHCTCGVLSHFVKLNYHLLILFNLWIFAIKILPICTATYMKQSSEQQFPASVGHSRQEGKENERPPLSSETLFCITADHICNRNLLVFKTSFVLCGIRTPCLERAPGISVPTVIVQTGSVSCVAHD